MTRCAAALIVGVFSTACLFAGCGDDGGSANSVDSAEPEPIAKAAFLLRGNAICAKAKERKEREYRSGVDLVEASVAALETEVTEIETLGAPSGDGPEVEMILDAAHQVIARAEDDFARATQLLAKSEKLADRYGLKVCFVN